MREIDRRLQFCRDGFMPRKFFTVVECDGVAFALVWSQQTRYYSRYTIGMAARDMPRQHIARFSLCQGNQSAFVILANDGVTLPITNARLLVDNFRALFNADAVLDRAPPLLPARIMLAPRFLAT